VPLLIPEGVTILAGKPKVGKSWFALDLALALAGGRFVLGDIHLIEGDVLYAAPEDNDRRLRARIERILTQNEQKWPDRLTLTTKWNRLDAGGVADAKEWAASVTRPRLMIFDTLAGFRGDRNNKDTTMKAITGPFRSCRTGRVRPGLAP
jgi:RecA-family ATPase